MAWGVGATAPFDVEAHLIAELPDLLGDIEVELDETDFSAVQVAIDMQDYTAEDERILVSLAGSYPREHGRRQCRINFQSLAPSKERAWDIVAALITVLGELTTTGRVTSAQVATGPTPLPSGYADNGEPARYYLAVDLITVDL